MLRNYIITALRNLFRHKQYTLINVLGLAVGFSACILMMLYVRHELSYDSQWEKADRIAVVHSRFNYSANRVDEFAGAAGPFKHALPAYFPEEIKQATRFYTLFPNVFIGEKVTDQALVWTDAETLDMFDFDVISGDMASVFADSRSLGLSETVAMKFFGSTDVVGQLLTLEMGSTREDFRVAVIYRDLPQTTTVSLPALARFDETSAFPGYSSNWWNIRATTYVELEDGVSPALINDRLEGFVNSTVPEGFFKEVEKTTDLLTVSILPLRDMRLHGLAGTQSTVQMVSAIAALVLMIASINFINLTTAKGGQRAREVALRKTLGASRGNLIVQFLGESVVMVMLALLIGLFLTEVSLPAFAEFVSKDLALHYGDPFVLSLSVGLVLGVGLLGGFYPAYILSAYRPSETLKANKSTETSGTRRLRGGLVVVQFMISVILIVAASLIYIQRDYAINLDPGFNQKNLITVQYLFRGDTASNRKLLKDRVLALPGVTAASFSQNTPPYGAGSPITLERNGYSKVSLPWQQQDADYFDVYQVPLVAGRSFRADHAAMVDKQRASLPDGAELQMEILLNESAARALGFVSAHDALGEVVRSDEFRRPTVMTIVGVVADTRINSTRSAAPPQFYTPAPSESSLTFRYAGQSGQMIADLQAMWQQLYPEVPLYFYSVDDAMRQAFDEEVKASVLLTLFSGLAIFVACLGLYGLAAFVTERRTKEVGVRKVMGARVLDIIQLFLWQFARPVLWANLLAWPIAAWIMLKWLESFPYRVDEWVLLPLCLGAGLLTLLVAWFTVGGSAAKVARSRPVEALRYE